MLLSVQVTSILLLTLIHANAEAPPGYVKPAEAPGKIVPKYEYGYNIDDKGSSHGKVETRDGIYALGRYYVQGTDSTHNVQYYADDWGYHPFIEYSNVGPHSKTRTQLLLGVEAVKALASNKFTSHSVHPKQHVTDTITSRITGRDGQNTQPPQGPKQNFQIVLEQPQHVQHHVVTQQPPVVVQQPPVVIQQPQVILQQPPQVIVQQQQQIQQPQPIQVEQQQQIQQTQQVGLGQLSELQSQQSQADQSDSVVVEASGRQSQENVRQQQNFQQQQQIFQQEASQGQQFQQENFVQQRLIQPQQEQQIFQQENSQQQVFRQENVQQQQQVFQQENAQQQQIFQQEIPQQQQIFQQEQQFQQENIVQQRLTQPQQEISQQQLFQQENAQQHQQQNVQQRLPQPQLEQILLRQEITHQQPQNVEQLAQPQLEQSEIRQEVSHQQQQVDLRPQALPLRGNFAQENTNQIQENLIQSQEETEALLERSEGQQILQQANLGGFGSRLNLLGRRRPSYNVQIEQSEQNPGRLIETTRNLVSGQDVLNINGAFDQKSESNFESSTARAITDNQNLVSTVTEASLINQPIIVADFDEKIISSTENYLNLEQQGREQIYSTTASTVETLPIKSFGITEPSELLVTPRPVSTKFLAPIQVGIQLQANENRIQLQQTENSQNVASRIQLQNFENQNIQSSTSKDNYIVEIQKSLPLYLGKFEYEQNPTALGSIEVGSRQSQSGNAQQKAVENIELGKTLFAFDEQNSQQQRQQQSGDVELQQRFRQQLQQQGNGNAQLRQQNLRQPTIKDNFVDNDQQQSQRNNNQIVQRVTSPSPPIVIEKIIEREVPVTVTKIIEKPVEITKIVKQPYEVRVPVHIPVEVPVTIEKKVPYAVPVERIVEKPVTVTEVVEKRIHIPQPYAVEKIVEKQVHVPYPVTKYVDRPYPVEVRVPQPYPVDRIVEKIVKQPYPVTVRVPVEVKVPYEKIVERKVPQYIERKVPVERIVEKQVPRYIDRPYPVGIQLGVPLGQVYNLALPTKTFQPAPVSITLNTVERSQRLRGSVRNNEFQNQLQFEGQRIQSAPINNNEFQSQLQFEGQRQSASVNNEFQGQLQFEGQRSQQSGPVKTLSDYQQQDIRGQLQGLQLQGQQLQEQLLRGQIRTEQSGQIQAEQSQFAQGSIRSNEYLPPSPAPSPAPVNEAGGEYLPPPPPCDQQNSLSTNNPYYTIQPDDYIGLAPPRFPENSQIVPKKFRNARSNFNNNLRVEYGFKPPLRPSQEIDENGKAIIREEIV